jgi:hypothetical protein
MIYLFNKGLLSIEECEIEEKEIKKVFNERNN